MKKGINNQDTRLCYGVIIKTNNPDYPIKYISADYTPNEYKKGISVAGGILIRYHKDYTGYEGNSHNYKIPSCFGQAIYNVTERKNLHSRLGIPNAREEMHRLLVRLKPYFIGALAAPSDDVQIISLVNSGGMSLQYFAPSDENICRIAVGLNGEAIEYVPRNLNSIELCVLAVKQNANYITKCKVPDEWLQEIRVLAQDVYDRKILHDSAWAMDKMPEICLASSKDGGDTQWISQRNFLLRNKY